MYIEIENSDIKNFSEQKVILFGAGSCGLRAIEEFEKVGAEVIGFCDNNTALRGKRINGHIILSPNDLYSYPDASVIITSTYATEIRKQLDQMKIKSCFIAKVGVLKTTIEISEFYNKTCNGKEANKVIHNGLLNNKPFFVGRLGSVELECLSHYLYLIDRHTESYPDNVKMIMNINAGFFPKEDYLLDYFSKIYINDLKEMDLIWTMWFSKYENFLYRDIASDIVVSPYDDSYLPNNYDTPWTRALEGKRVLVIHPFEVSIINNYSIIDKIHPNNLIPQFELITLKAVQSIAGTHTEFNTWFDALEFMKSKIDKIEFDIALIGAGAYGLPLGAYVKSIGKKAVHVGGALQLYFGIKGKAWDKLGIYNEYWTSPLDNERPEGFAKVEAGRYW
nr:hypothetical protein [uncultured Anaerosporobacter sp.]